MKKSYSFMIITFLVMLFISTNNVNAQGTSVSGSSATLVFGNGSSSSCNQDFCDYQLSGTFSNSISYMNLYFTNNIPKDKKVILSFSESVYQGSNFLVSGFNSTNLDISSVAVAVSSENGYLIYSYTIIGTMLNTQNYITLTHNVQTITTNNSWYKIQLPNLTYYDVSDSDSILADILAQQQQWATQQNTYLGYITSNTDDIKTALANQSSSIVSAITSSSQQQHQDSQAINDSINNDNTSGAESSADDLVNNSAFDDNTGLSGIISMPLTLVNNLGNACSPISLTIPYIDYSFQIPCIQSIVNQYMPALVVVLKVIVNGLIIYWVMIDIFHIVKSAKNPDDDRIEVLDL